MDTIIGIPVVLSIFWLVIFIPTHIASSAIVYRDARHNQRSALNITPFLWFGFAFSLPILGMFIYWLMTHSTLSKQSL